MIVASASLEPERIVNLLARSLVAACAAIVLGVLWIEMRHSAKPPQRRRLRDRDTHVSHTYPIPR